MPATQLTIPKAGLPPDLGDPILTGGHSHNAGLIASLASQLLSGEETALLRGIVCANLRQIEGPELLKKYRFRYENKTQIREGSITGTFNMQIVLPRDGLFSRGIAKCVPLFNMSAGLVSFVSRLEPSRCEGMWGLNPKPLPYAITLDFDAINMTIPEHLIYVKEKNAHITPYPPLALAICLLCVNTDLDFMNYRCRANITKMGEPCSHTAMVSLPKPPKDLGLDPDPSNGLEITSDGRWGSDSLVAYSPNLP